MSLGLNWAQRYATRQRVKRAALAAVRRAWLIHYTQGAARWQGINRRLHAAEGQFPAYADCSSFTTWLLWDATRRCGFGDFVNGCSWNYGYTGTQVQHGRDVPVNRARLLVGDLVFYGGWAVPSHVAVYVGGGLVVSHGNERAPSLLRWDYRTPSRVKRYVR